MAQRITGFSRAAKVYVERNPGRTAKEVVDYVLRSGEASSAAQDPRGSLVATLHKHHRQLGLDRRQVNGSYRYYPRNGLTPASPPPPVAMVRSQPDGDAISVTLRVARSVSDVMDTLIAIGTCKTRADAALWLMNKGISAMRLDRRD